MSKLYFRFGVMGSSKTASALMTRFNYIEKGYNVLLLKPSLDTRDGEKIIKSRIGLSAEAVLVLQETNIYKLFTNFKNINCIIVDEAQFLTREQVTQLKDISIKIPVFCYGLRTDFQSNLFEGSKRLFEIADSITELKSVCHCGKKAIINARYENGKIIYNGEQIQIGGNESYIGLCYECWKNGKLS